MLDSKLRKENKKPSLMIYADFESILVAEDNGKQNPDKPYAKKHKKMLPAVIVTNVDDTFSNPFKSYIGEGVVYNFINSMLEESRYYSDLLKNIFKIVMTKKMMKIFRAKCWVCENVYVDGDVKVIYHCHITGKYRGYAHKDCNIKVKFNYKIPFVFQNFKNYDSHLIIQKLGKFDLLLTSCQMY